VHGWALWAIERLETMDDEDRPAAQAEENLSSSATAS